MHTDSANFINRFRDNRDWNRSRDVDERRNSRDDRKDRDRRDRGRDRHRDRRDRGGRSRNRSRSRDAESRNRSREHRNRDRPKDGGVEKREDPPQGEEKKSLTPWVEVPPAANNSEKPSLMQRLRSIAEGGSGVIGGGGSVGPIEPPFIPPMDDRQGPPIVNLNNSGKLKF